MIFHFHRLGRTPNRRLYIATLLIFFWVVFDGIMSYLVPILINQRGFSDTQLGLILSFSSVAGAFFDIALSRFLKRTNYLKTFFLIISIALLFPLTLWYSNNLPLYLLAMAIWGLYYDFYTFAVYDFVGHNNPIPSTHSHDFGVIELFRSLAGLLAPIIATWLIIDHVTLSSVTFPYLFLIIAFVFYLVLFISSPLSHVHQEAKHYRIPRFWVEIKLWLKISRIIFPVLLFLTCLQVFDAVFWTIGPLFFQEFPDFKHFSGYLMAFYNLPSLVTAWTVSSITNKLGKKRTAYCGLMFASLLLIPIGYLNQPAIILTLVLISSTAISITWPAIEATIADYVSETKIYGSEIEGLTDLTGNFGYIIGPILAGVFSDSLGIKHSFTLLGLVVALVVLFLFFITPRHITVKVPRSTA